MKWRTVSEMEPIGLLTGSILALILKNIHLLRSYLHEYFRQPRAKLRSVRSVREALPSIILENHLISMLYIPLQIIMSCSAPLNEYGSVG